MKADKMRDSTIFYASFYDAIKDLPQQNQIEVYNAIFELSLKGNNTELTGLSKTIFTLIRPQLTANLARYENGKKGASHGKKGGRPSKEKPLENPKITPSITPNVNVNVNVNENNNLNDNVNDIYKYWNSKTGQSLKGDKNVTTNLKTILKDYSIDDIKSVIDYMIRTPDIYKNKGYLVISTMSRPTEFGNKLDKATNSKPIKSTAEILKNCNSQNFESEF